ncbi:M23 family metallopeptidase [Actinomadura hibisca]|uniref:M23 family metallopeptidase n=1 Tax=Actinomadura hibisca TaxID=68565 RepID=UPI00083342C8|nr:M23 family metallopeptidase [Actinomadura hibisca]
MKFFAVLIRCGTPIAVAGLLLILVGWLTTVPRLGLAGFVLILLGTIPQLLPVRLGERAPVALRSPVQGRWVAVNSPADKVPSHGTHELGQSYAIDLVHAPDPAREWKALVGWPLAARPATFPAFGRPVLAPADGTVVAVGRHQRDHWSRNSWPALIYLMVEGMVFRSIGSLLTLSPARFVLGNHVILDLGDGVYGVFAHLRRGSVRVRPGDRVRAGDQLGEVGNSGNSSEPHLHFHLMDGPHPMWAQGVPFTIEYRTDDGEARTGVPAGKHPFVVPDPAANAADPSYGVGAQPGIG